MKSKSEQVQESKKQGGFWFWALLGGATVAYYTVLRPKLLTWGSQSDEIQQSMAGDEIIMHPQVTLTHARTIQAPIEILWAWLAQMGREHVGFYVWDQIYNQGVRSAISLRPDLPPVAVGMRLTSGLQVLSVSPQDSLVLGGFNLPTIADQPYDITYSYRLQRLSPHQTRLVLRMRLYAYGLTGLVYPMLAEPFYAIQAITQFSALTDRAHSTPAPAATMTSKEKANGHQPITL